MHFNLILPCVIFSFVIKQALPLSCYVCDIRSVRGYEAANKICNAPGPVKCRRPREQACMIETYRSGLVYQVVKTCLPQCPVFVNTSATNVRCCVTVGCNDLITAPTGLKPFVRNRSQNYDQRGSIRPQMRAPPYRRTVLPSELMVGQVTSADYVTRDVPMTNGTTTVTTTMATVNKKETGDNNKRSQGPRRRIKDRKKAASSSQRAYLCYTIKCICIILIRYI